MVQLKNCGLCSSVRNLSVLATLTLPACVSDGLASPQISAGPVREGQPMTTGLPPYRLPGGSRPGLVLENALTSGQSQQHQTSLGRALEKGLNRPLRSIERMVTEPQRLQEGILRGVVSEVIRQARKEINLQIADENDSAAADALREQLLPPVTSHRAGLFGQDGSDSALEINRRYADFRPALHGIGRVSFGVVDDDADSVRVRVRFPTGKWGSDLLAGDCRVEDYISRFGMTASFDIGMGGSCQVVVDRDQLKFEMAVIF